MKDQFLRKVDAETTAKWIETGKAILIDIREPDEYIREHIPGAQLVPLSGFNSRDFTDKRNKIAVFHCRSGGRTEASAPQILATGFSEVYQLDGGIKAWRDAGFQINENVKAPISIMRQVQIVAGSLVLLGAVLAFAVNPWFIALSGFVGAGLAQAGITGTCAMASLLKFMPWNRAITSQQGLPKTA